MTVENHQLRYRPLRPGVMIYNPNVKRRGTIGLFATSDGTDRWLISADHVLQLDTNAQDNDPIYQPFNGVSQEIVARTSTARRDRMLDMGAAKVEAGISISNDVLGVGALGPPRGPHVGLSVIKAGGATGITEGVIDQIVQDSVTIVVRSGYPPGYNLTNAGDSGALWVAQSSRRPVAVHVAGNVTGPETATAVSISRVLIELGLDSLN